MDENMLRMQQEAVERVRQMQKRARQYVESERAPDNDIQTSGMEKKEHSALADKNFLSEIADSEQLLLLMLAVLLVKSDARIELILALLYIAM